MLNRLADITLKFLSLGLFPLVVVLWCRQVIRRKSGRAGDVSAPPIVLSLSQVLWDDVWQRPQEYAWRTAIERPVVYCAPVQIHNWLRTLKSRWKPYTVWHGERELVVVSPLVFSGHFKSELIFAINCRIMRSWLKPWLPATPVDCVVNTPYVLPVVEQLVAEGAEIRTLTYDVIDDFTSFDWSPAFGKELDERLMTQADTVFTGTYELLAERRSRRPEAEFIACGVDFERFHQRAAAPADLKDLVRPLIGYFGTISDRLDIDLINEVALAYPDATVVMIGPVHLPENVLPRGSGNIRYLGLKRHEDLPAYAQAFAVGMIPFRITEATVKLNPVKTLEYLAAGLPVVATAIPDLQRFFSQTVRIACTNSEYVQLIGEAIGDRDQTMVERGIEQARSASWQAMVDRMNALVMCDRTDIPAASMSTEAQV